MKYSFKKVDLFTREVFLNHNGEQLFVCNLFDHELVEGKTKSQIVDEQLKQADYTSREHFWKVMKGEK